MPEKALILYFWRRKESPGLNSVVALYQRVHYHTWILEETNKEKYNAKVVIGADGVNSIVYKYVRDSYKPDELGFCIAAEIPASNEEVNEYIENAHAVKLVLRTHR